MIDSIKLTFRLPVLQIVSHESGCRWVIKGGKERGHGARNQPLAHLDLEISRSEFLLYLIQLHRLREFNLVKLIEVLVATLDLLILALPPLCYIECGLRFGYEVEPFFFTLA